MHLKAIIVEDEKLGQEALMGILNNFCENTVEVISVVDGVQSAVAAIEKDKPNLLFLDIKLGMNDHGAFDILEKISYTEFSVIFTTSSKQPANILLALNNFGAKKYLLKPLDISEVVEAVNLIYDEFNQSETAQKIDEVKQLLIDGKPIELGTKLSIPVRNGFQYVDYCDIVMMRSDANNTLVFLSNGNNLSSSRNLKYFQGILPENTFMRVSRSYVININHVEKYQTEDGGTIFLSQECSAALSAKYSKKFFAVFGV